MSLLEFVFLISWPSFDGAAQASISSSLIVLVSAMDTLFSLRGRTAVVTGGTRGIGQHMSYALAEAGADIILIARSPEAASSTKSHIEFQHLIFRA